MITENELHDIILIHTARTWERIRLTKPFNEMVQDNIQSSTDAIPEIAYIVLQDSIIQKLLKYNGDTWNWYDITNGVASASDEYIQHLANKLINKYY